MQFSLICTGSSGLVASSFKALAKQRGIGFEGIDLNGEEVATNILDTTQLRHRFETLLSQAKGLNLQPIVFHFAAFTATGKSLSEQEKNLSQALNITGTENVLEICRHLSLPFVHISTDFVFSGSKQTKPFQPTDPQKPDGTVYAQTKTIAEKRVQEAASAQSVAIIRIAFPYGNLAHPKPDLLKKMLTWMTEKEEVFLYEDQHTCPTPVDLIAAACLKTAELMISKQIQSGQILHVVGRPTTPLQFGQLVKEIFEKKTKVSPSQVGDASPGYLVLDTTETEHLLQLSIPDHREVLQSLARQ